MTSTTHPHSTTTRRVPGRSTTRRPFDRILTLVRRLSDGIADAAVSWQLGGDPEVEVGRRTGARI